MLLEERSEIGYLDIGDVCPIIYGYHRAKVTMGYGSNKNTNANG